MIEHLTNLLWFACWIEVLTMCCSLISGIFVSIILNLLAIMFWIYLDLIVDKNKRLFLYDD